MANVDTLPEILRPLMEGPSIETPRCAVCGAPWPLNRHHIVRRGAGKLFRDGREVPKPTVMLCGSGNGSGCHGAGARQPAALPLGSGPSRGSTAPPRRARGTGSTCCCRNRPSTRMPWPWTAGVGCRGAGGACERVRAFKRVEPPARVLRVRPQGTVEPARPVGGPHVPGVPLLRPRAGRWRRGRVRPRRHDGRRPPTWRR